MSESSEELEARIAAYIDGQLPASEAARLEVFLANTDPKLAEQIIGMLSDRHRLRALPRGVAPPDLAARVMEQVERATLLNDVDQESHGRRTWWHSRRLGAAAAVLMLGGFTYFVVTMVVSPGHDPRIGKVVSRDNKEADRAADRQLQEADRAKGGPADASSAGGFGGGGGSGRAAPAMSKSSDGGVQADKESPRLASALRNNGPEFGAMKASAPEHRAVEEKSHEQVEASLQEQVARSRDVSQNGKAVAKKLGYTPVESADKAFASLSVGSVAAGEPVVMTLVARDEHDFARLRQALVELMNQDPSIGQRQVALQTRYLNITSNTQQFNGGQQVNGNIAANSAPAGPANLRGGNALPDQPANNSSGYAASTPTNNTAINLSNNATIQQAAKDNNTGGVAGEANRSNNNDAIYQFYNFDQRRFDLTSEGNNGVAGNLLNNGNATNQAQALGGAQTAEKVQALGQQAQQAGNAEVVGPSYRVALRPEHLRRLAAEFQVNSVTCGQQAFVIAEEPRRAVARGTPTAREDADNARKELEALASRSKTDSSSQLAPAAAAPAPAATTLPAASPEAVAEAGRDRRTTAKTGMEESQNKPAPPVGGLGTVARDGRWLECVITMEPRPAKEPGEAAAPATQHAK